LSCVAALSAFEGSALATAAVPRLSNQRLRLSLLTYSSEKAALGRESLVPREIAAAYL
jgi:hypothetical protein